MANFSDDFNRPDGPAGAAYAYLGGGTLAIAGHLAHFDGPAPGSFAVHDVGSPNMGVTATWGGGAQNAGVAARVVDASNAFVVIARNDGTIGFYKLKANAYTPLGSAAHFTVATDAVTLDVTAADAFSVLLNGTAIVGPVTDHDFAAATRGGLFSYSDPNTQWSALAIVDHGAGGGSTPAVLPAGVVYAQDFDALPTGPLADFVLSGGANFTVGTIDPVSGTQSFGTATPAGMMAAVATATGGAPVPAVAELEVYYEHVPHSPGGSGSMVFTPVLRADAGFTRGYWFAGNPGGCVLFKRVGGADAQRGGFTQFAAGPLSPDVAYNVRARVETQPVVNGVAPAWVRLRVWPHGGAEPAVWDYDFADDTDPIAAAGYGGVLVYSTSANTAPLAFDTIRVVDLTAAPPPGTTLAAAGAPGQQDVVRLSAAAATGGDDPKTYRWYAATTAGTPPAPGNAVAGGTALLMIVPRPLVTTYFTLVATDAASASVTYPEVAVAGAAGGGLIAPGAASIFSSSIFRKG